LVGKEKKLEIARSKSKDKGADTGGSVRANKAAWDTGIKEPGDRLQRDAPWDEGTLLKNENVYSTDASRKRRKKVGEVLQSATT